MVETLLLFLEVDGGACLARLSGGRGLLGMRALATALLSAQLARPCQQQRHTQCAEGSWVQIHSASAALCSSKLPRACTLSKAWLGAGANSACIHQPDSSLDCCQGMNKSSSAPGHCFLPFALLNVLHWPDLCARIPVHKEHWTPACSAVRMPMATLLFIKVPAHTPMLGKLVCCASSTIIAANSSRISRILPVLPSGLTSCHPSTLFTYLLATSLCSQKTSSSPASPC